MPSDNPIAGLPTLAFDALMPLELITYFSMFAGGRKVNLNMTKMQFSPALEDAMNVLIEKNLVKRTSDPMGVAEIGMVHFEPVPIGKEIFSDLAKQAKAFGIDVKNIEKADDMGLLYVESRKH